MPKKTPEAFEYLANDPNFVPDPEIEEFMENEIAHAPKDRPLARHDTECEVVFQGFNIDRAIHTGPDQKRFDLRTEQQLVTIQIVIEWLKPNAVPT